MTDRSAFLAAILATPRDDLPRLAFADWLEERGESPRAAFIRLQCEARRHAPHTDRRFELERQADDLMREHVAEWMGEWAGRVINWEFRRGFVHSVRLTDDAFLNQGDALFRWEPVERFTFINANGYTLTDPQAVALTRHPAFAHVRAVHVHPHRDQLEGSVNGWLEGLAEADHVRHLREFVVDEGVSRQLGFGRSGGVVEEVFELFCRARQLRSLRRLVLNNIAVWDRETRPWVAEGLARAAFVGSLRHLEVKRCGLGDNGLRRIASDPVFANLRRLDVAYNSKSAAVTIEVLHAPHLTRLSDVCVTADHLGVLADSPVAGRLRGLSVEAVGDDAWDCEFDRAEPFWERVIAKVNRPIRLKMRCHNPGPRALAAMRKAGWLRRVRSLDLAGDSQYGVFDEGLSGVNRLFRSPRTLPRLTRLRLHEAADDQTLQVLAAWPGLGRLSSLELTDDYGGRLCADRFRPTTPLRRLKTLSGVRVVHDADCIHLANILADTKLRSLDLVATPEHQSDQTSTLHLTADGLLELLRSPALSQVRQANLGFHDLQEFAAEVLRRFDDPAVLPKLRTLYPGGLYDTPSVVRQSLTTRLGLGAKLFRDDR